MALNFKIHTNSPQSPIPFLTSSSSSSSSSSNCIFQFQIRAISYLNSSPRRPHSLKLKVWCSDKPILRTCKNCKTQFDPCLNHPRACRFHTAHFAGETKRKFESVYSGGTMNTPNSGQVLEYWHCCGSEDPFDPGCTAAPHSSYDD